jgi:hypothetical protein
VTRHKTLQGDILHANLNDHVGPGTRRNKVVTAGGQDVTATGGNGGGAAITGGDPGAGGIVSGTAVIANNGRAGNRGHVVTCPAPAMVLLRLVIYGFDGVTVGNTVTFSAYGYYSDQSNKDLTNQVTWSVNDPSIARNPTNANTFTGLSMPIRLAQVAPGQTGLLARHRADFGAGPRQRWH